ncbi:pepsinogen a [Stylonychia lemnae]|uniref:Pepsinogen a n=1 Tax=Stylonychia lemnae TaxID=5949 RepID=A0A077ZY27_STYLE|nr:pepsinogen a [Stylonychia lemnae]|eukprot:CDW74522.1 pepsinogen a [Stylonychia lemnae]
MYSPNSPLGTNSLHQLSYLVDPRMMEVQITQAGQNKSRIDFPLQNVKNVLVIVTCSIQVQYWGTIKVGNPPVDLRADFDTGSTNMWIVRTCKSQNQLSDSTVQQIESDCYDPAQSQSAVQLEASSKITFGKGHLQGPWGEDSVWLGEMEIKNQHMAFAEVSDAFADGTGILLGLGFPSMSAYQFTPAFDHMMQLGVLPHNVFSFSLGVVEDTPSHLILGQIDDSQYQGNISYYPVVDQQFWTISLQDVLIGNQSLNICSKDDPCYAALDSGTSFLTFPPEKYDKLAKEYPNINQCLFGVMQPDLTNLENPQMIECHTVISPLKLVSYAGNDIFLLGDVFMQLFYTIFDRDHARIGLAKAANPPQSNRIF